MPWGPISCSVFFSPPPRPHKQLSRENHVAPSWPISSIYVHDPIHKQYYIFNMLFKWYHTPCSFFKLGFFFHLALCFGDLSISLYIGASAFFI